MSQQARRNSSLSEHARHEAEALVAELCILTDDEEIKTVVKKYLQGTSVTNIEKRLTQGPCSNKHHLEKTLIFINSGMDDHNIPRKRDDIAKQIVVRIQNLLPDECGFCGDRYKLGITEKPSLQCDRCGQSAHKPCIRDMLNKRVNTPIESEEELSHTFVWELINPLNFPGMVYLCKACEGSNSHTNQQAASSEPVSTMVESQEQSAQAPADSNIIREGGTISEITVDSRNRDTDEHEDEHNSNQNRKPIVCKFFKRNACRHGPKGDECKYAHPEICKKFIQHGTRQPQGCTKGSKCEHMHPQMCMSSLRRGKCLNKSCKFRHVKGTVRETTNTSRNTSRNSQTTQHNQNSNHFLEEFRQLKADLFAEMDKRMSNPEIKQHHNQQQQHQQYLQQQQQPAINHPQQQQQLHNMQIQIQQLQQALLQAGHRQQTQPHNPQNHPQMIQQQQRSLNQPAIQQQQASSSVHPQMFHQQQRPLNQSAIQQQQQAPSSLAIPQAHVQTAQSEMQPQQ